MNFKWELGSSETQPATFTMFGCYSPSNPRLFHVWNKVKQKPVFIGKLHSMYEYRIVIKRSCLSGNFARCMNTAEVTPKVLLIRKTSLSV
jgi:hypothetical protein